MSFARAPSGSFPIQQPSMSMSRANIRGPSRQASSLTHDSAWLLSLQPLMSIRSVSRSYYSRLFRKAVSSSAWNYEIFIHLGAP